MKKYGMHPIGKHTVVFLRVKLTLEVRTELLALYSDDLMITESMKGYTMIEGCLRNKEVVNFWDALQIAKMDSKITFMEQERAEYIARLIPSFSHMVGPEDVELPF